MYTFLNLQRKLEQENAALKESKNECECSLQHHQLELKKLKVFIYLRQFHKVMSS